MEHSADRRPLDAVDPGLDGVVDLRERCPARLTPQEAVDHVLNRLLNTQRRETVEVRILDSRVLWRDARCGPRNSGRPALANARGGEPTRTRRTGRLLRPQLRPVLLAAASAPLCPGVDRHPRTRSRPECPCGRPRPRPSRPPQRPRQWPCRIDFPPPAPA